jgi:phosphopantothenoylcysteine synthetase/decarboxylase
VIAAAGRIKKPNQKTVGFSLESTPDMDRVRDKMRQKNLDLMVYNPVATIGSDSIQPSLLHADGRVETSNRGPKPTSPICSFSGRWALFV